MGLIRLTQINNPRAFTLDFLAVFHEQNEDVGSLLHSLSPRVMHWNPCYSLLDMRACRAYWQHKAQQEGQELSTLLQDELTKLFLNSKYHAAVAKTPSEAIVLVQAAEDKGFQGLIHADSRLGKNLSNSLSWDLWWDFAKIYAEKSNVLPALFRKSQHAMTLAMQRLGMKSPNHLRNLPSSHMQRRFGKTIADAWQLTYPERQGLDSKGAIALFPWQGFQLEEELRVRRHLDQELRDWQPIEELLREDINRLTRHPNFAKDERVLVLEWQLTLWDLSEWQLCLSFRHPHNLHQEMPEQKTALLQFQHLFEKESRYRKLTAENSIIAWKLILKEKAPARFRQHSLFEESRDELSYLRHLENMIKRPLEAYQLEEDWLAEDSFCEQDPIFQATGEREDYLPLNQKRPLFLYHEAKPLAPELLSRARFGSFQERTMDKWWKNSAENLSRDYYQLFHQDLILWVFRDQSGTWRSHGIYG